MTLKLLFISKGELALRIITLAAALAAKILVKGFNDFSDVLTLAAYYVHKTILRFGKKRTQLIFRREQIGAITKLIKGSAA